MALSLEGLNFISSYLIPIYQTTHRAIVETLNKEVEKAIAEYNDLAEHQFPKQYPNIRGYLINITNGLDSITATIIAIPRDHQLAQYTSNKEADVVDEVFKNVLKRHLPSQKNFTIHGYIQMSIIAQPFNPNR